LYLIDTNVWLERLLDQAKSDEVGRLFDRVVSEELFITDFTFHSMGVVMSRLRRTEALLRFVQDAFIDGGVVLIHLKPEDMDHLVQIAERYGLDFDDAYQYVAATKHNLTMVSFDADFDNTELGRRTPADIVRGDMAGAQE